MFQRISAANRVSAVRVLSTNDNKDSHPTSGLFQPTPHTSETAHIAMPPCHILPTNQKTLLSRPIHIRPHSTNKI
ncbi:hypothetical protein TNCV_2704791 [Trichonephila clavipes]|nr:hypothetical protein TNCV_2704791 [Trichonephila clavipes]